MPAVPAVISSSLGKKYLMAVTGLMLLGFVIMHLAGNLLIFLGPGIFNTYAKKLLDLGGLLWAARILLLAALIIHIVTAVKLAAENRAARPEKYAVKDHRVATYASRTMMMSGMIIFAFLVYHLLHFTFRVTNPDISHGVDAFGRHDTYSMVVLSFQMPLISVVYVAAQLLLAMHLSHGIASLFQSLGWNNDAWRERLRISGYAIGYGIFIGYILIPIAVMLGWVSL